MRPEEKAVTLLAVMRVRQFIDGEVARGEDGLLAGLSLAAEILRVFHERGDDEDRLGGIEAAIARAREKATRRSSR